MFPLDVISRGSGLNRRGDVFSSHSSANFRRLDVVVVSTGCGAKRRTFFCVVSMGSGANFRLVLIVVSTGSGAKVLFVDCVISIG